MFTGNPFSEISSFIPPAVMQVYIVVMALFVAGGTLFDMVHKKSAKYFFQDKRKKQARATNQLQGGEKVGIFAKTLLIDVLTQGEFCRIPRRLAHLLTFYGFIGYIFATVIMVFVYPLSTAITPAWVPVLWYVSGGMVMLGGYWFWFTMRVDVAKEGNPVFRAVKADLFVLSLLASVTFGFVWGLVQTAGSATWAFVLLCLYLTATTVLYVSVPWSKFSHMFYKPAAAFQKKFEEADGSTNLPPPSTSGGWGTYEQR